MKGLYYQLSAVQDEEKFIFQEKEPGSSPSDYHVKLQVKACALSPINTKLISKLYPERDFVAVGREVAGIILEVGSKVSFFHPDDEAVGILPLDAEDSGLCDVVWVHEHHFVHKPEKVSWAEAAGTIRDGLCVYTALHSLAHLAPGRSVLVLDGASPIGTLAIQLSHHSGATVIATANSEEDKQYLDKLRPGVGVRQPAVARVIDLSKGNIDLAEKCLEETGGLGVDIVLDAGASFDSRDWHDRCLADITLLSKDAVSVHELQRNGFYVILYNTEDHVTKPKLQPHKHDIITLLSVGGHWVTREHNLQLDPPDSHNLFLKGASLSFLNDEIWNLSNAQQGKYLHILKDVVDKLSCGVFRPQLDELIPLYEAKVVMEMVQKDEVKKRQVVQL